MNITDIRIRKTYSDNRLRALVSITVDYDLAVHDIKIIEGTERLFVAMPSRKDENGTFRDISHPITPQARKQLEDAVLQAYQQYITQQQEVGDDSTPDSFPILLPPQNSLPVRLLCGSKIFTIIQTLPFMHKKELPDGSSFLFSLLIPQYHQGNYYYPQAGSPKHLPMVSQSTLAALLQRP